MTKDAYYNEIHPYAAAVLRELIAAGHIAPGIVDERSIEDVQPDDLRGYAQCHFFAGFGVWSYALRRAGIADSARVWTGSCPCQPFSAAGKGHGFADERHLWPAFLHLISQCEPAAILGEQVAAKAVEPWIDLVHADLEALGYAFGCVPFPSAGVGAPHIRDRAYWVANASDHGLQGRLSGRPNAQWGVVNGQAGRDGAVGGLVYADGSEHETFRRYGLGAREPADASACSGSAPRPAGPTNGLWADADWLFCRDGKWRPVEPGTFPLAHGAAARVGRLRGYGNAINAKAAQAFIESCGVIA